ncbi:DUF4157 domain-containing protein [Actinoplanes sp. NPDC051346]|uniref:eCIS core domain-containing protein n=1 Tax=Actinoplanes sp. NPDC051346 TaxID=3155048 RepID=UPI003432BD31
MTALSAAPSTDISAPVARSDGQPSHRTSAAAGLAEALRDRTSRTARTVRTARSAPASATASTAAERASGLRGPVRPGPGPSVHHPGPSVHNPQPVGHLRVLGAATLPPGAEPDPSGAVHLGPAAGQRPGPAAGRRRTIGDFAVPVPERSPRERWEAAVAARPLEAPRPLPSAFHAMATAITGRSRPPLFTTGPATRHALSAAGALGATTGTVVHLPAPPTNAPAVSAVLAHELAHTRSPVRRPRFLLGGASGLLDDDERQALAAGRQRLAQEAPTAAGIVDQLPVGGGMGAVGDVATRAARAAVMEAAAGPMAAASGWASGTHGPVSSVMDAASGAMDLPNGLASGAMDAAAGAANAVGGLASQAGSAASGVAGGLASGAVGGLASAARAAIDPDTIVEIVEQRLLREIERRGGRWAGVF